ncbi:BAHD ACYLTRANSFERASE DCR-RELATED [Salix viminalis]|uniref:BAHD ACYLTRANSFERASE DCR-RELATED n=1 Tax=Salix viminalis TaxID=40686 RepID=A0A9Q0SGE3_SALVM|nr:BAHD ACYLTRANSFERASE DCR-RELATED [Salix viminalis]
MAPEKEKEEIMEVKITGKSRVKPNKKLGRSECQLVTFDLPYIAFYYNQKLIVYKGNEYEDRVEKLKDGLGVVLEDFYQLAGKLAKDEDWVFRVEYDDDMEGVEVVEARAEWISVEDVAVEEGTSVLKELIPYSGILNSEGPPQTFAVSAANQAKRRTSNGIGLQPCHPRWDLHMALHEFMGPDLQWAAFNLSPTFHGPHQRIDKIKSELNSNMPPGSSKPFSTFQSLAVHIWRHVTQARQLKPEDYTVFTVFADCRKRVDPPMPESYFGNLIQAIFTVTAAGLLSMNPPEFGASMIQKAIETHDAKVIEERNKQFESAPKIFQFKDAGVNCVAVGSSPRFPVYEVDFGWGKPEAVRSGINNRFDGMVYLYQGKSGGRSIDVEISLEAGAMERLEKDKEFVLE